ncbi:MAG: hypothetical protein EOP48_32565 [Sphingobacteriales bacterium]|nr:MAG: hypothetical protein EOP48_32565 [Sphingobacteriales bacterium]
MTTYETMKWQEFKELLSANLTLDLQFQIAENKWVDASYHITEIKQAPITSVDCGGKMNAWTEIIVQLWEPSVRDSERAMKVSKALSIVALVEKSLPLSPNGIVKIEFGSNDFDTRQMLPNNIVANGENLIVDLRPDAVQCKAINRGGSCGTDENGNEKCVTDNKEKVQLVNLAAAETCLPGSGCCS